MGLEFSFDLRCDDGQDISVMQEIIEKRKNELGYTTAESCVALAINVLKSLRADTKKANPNERANITITDVTSEYYPSFNPKQKGSNVNDRCLRSGKRGGRVYPEFISWICDKYFRGQVLHTYKVVDTIADDKVYEYLVVAENEKKVMEYAKRRHKRRILRANGLAKFCLGLAMHSVHSAQNPQDEISDEARQTGLNNTHATVTDSGWESGDVAIHVEDNLKYATDAVRSGESAVEVATQKALNKMVGYLNHKLHQKGIYDDIKIPAIQMEDQ